MSLRSFRVRLALWYTSLIALVLAGFALLLSYGFQQTTARLVDRELAERADRMQRFARPRPGSPRLRDRRDRPPPDDRGPEGERRPRPAGRSFVDDAERVADTWRPRFWFAPDSNAPPDGTGDDLWDPAAVARAARQGRWYSTVERDGERLRVLSQRFADRGGRGGRGPREGVVQLARSLADYDRLWARQQQTLFALLPLCLLASGLGGLWLTDRALRPLRAVTRAAAEIGAADLSRRLPVQGHDELAELARTFNGMIARLEQAFEQQRRFTADASHEMRTPLARIKVTTSLALNEDTEPEEQREALSVVDRAADALAKLIDQLLTLARADAGELAVATARLDAREVVGQAVAALPPEQAARVTVVQPEGAWPLLGDELLLQRALGNLLDNALRHTPDDGRITVSFAAEPTNVVLTVTDTGEGIPPEHLPHLTERFYRVDPARSRRAGGTGLGLAICDSIARAHGGSLSLDSQPGEGTVAGLRLPRLPAEEPLPDGDPAATGG